MATAIRQFYGGSRTVAMSSDIVLRLPRGVNCDRLVVVQPTTTGLYIDLNADDYFVAGGLPQYTIVNDSANSVTVRNATASWTYLLLAGYTAKVFYAGSGTWFVRTSSHTVGTALPAGRFALELALAGPTYIDFDLRSFVDANIEAFGWDGEAPVALRSIIGDSVVFGSSDANFYGFDTGEWPGGSTNAMTLPATSVITGRGGAGGFGANTTGGLVGAGGAGGFGIRVRLDTNCVSEGRIQGGGGGGGGGLSTSAQAGGGGGGGCGYLLSQGGSPGTGGGGFAGFSGNIYVAGGGGQGAQQGGAGGAPGGAGSSTTGAPGGAGGDAVHYTNGITWNLTGSGTVLGAQVPV